MMPALAEIAFAATRIGDHHVIRMGEVALETVHTPGHRPEQICLLVSDLERGDEPCCFLTADCLLVGDLARPDLAQSGEAGAEMLFAIIIPRLKALPEFVEVYPGRVADSTWGRVTSGKFVTTIDYEKRYNPALQISDRAAFIHFMNAGQPVRPANILNIVAINQGKRPLTMHEPTIPRLSPAECQALIENGVMVIDTRSSALFGADHIPNAYNIQIESDDFGQRVGWVTPVDGPMLLVTERDSDARVALHKLAFLGLDARFKGYLTIL